MAITPMGFMGAGGNAAPSNPVLNSPLAGFIAAQGGNGAPMGFMPQAQSQSPQQPSPADLQAAAQQQAMLEQLAAAQPAINNAAQNNSGAPMRDARADMERQRAAKQPQDAIRDKEREVAFNSPVHAHADNSAQSAAPRDETAAGQETGSYGMIGGDSAAGQGRTPEDNQSNAPHLPPLKRIHQATARANAKMNSIPETPSAPEAGVMAQAMRNKQNGAR